MADDAYISLPILANPWHVSLSAFSIPSLVSLLAIAMGTSSRRNATTAEALLLALMLSSSAARAAAADPGFSCGPSSPSLSLPFCDRSLPAAQRAADLVSRMTVAEKVSQMGDEAAGVPRLGVPPYKYWSEGLHGLAFWGHGLRFEGAVRGVTSFPQVLLTAASFDEGLWFRIGQVSTPTLYSHTATPQGLQANTALYTDLNGKFIELVHHHFVRTKFYPCMECVCVDSITFS